MKSAKNLHTQGKKRGGKAKKGGELTALYRRSRLNSKKKVAEKKPQKEERLRRAKKPTNQPHGTAKRSD